MFITGRNINFNDIILYPDIDIPQYQVTFLTGKSGSGKSTFLKLLNGTSSKLSGTITYDKQNIDEIDTVLLRKEVLLVSQSIYLFDDTIYQNFKEFYQYRDLPIPDRVTIRKYLSICLADFPLDTLCTSLSGGERQRVFLAIYLSFAPKVLLLDEPTSALDTQNAYQIMQNILAFCKENQITVIIVSHDPTLPKKFGDHIINLEGSIRDESNR